MINAVETRTLDDDIRHMVSKINSKMHLVIFYTLTRFWCLKKITQHLSIYVQYISKNKKANSLNETLASIVDVY